MQTELGTEIGDQVAAGIKRQFMVGFAFSARQGQIGIEGRQYFLVVLHIDGIFAGRFEFLLGNPAQKDLGVMAAFLPQFRVEAHKQAAYLTVPAV